MFRHVLSKHLLLCEPGDQMTPEHGTHPALSVPLFDISFLLLLILPIGRRAEKDNVIHN